MKKTITILMLFAIALTMLITPGSVAAQEEMMNPAEVVEALYAAIGAKDIDAAVALLADEAVLTLIPAPPGYDGTFIGKAEIGAWYDGLAASNGRAELSNFAVVGNTVTYNLAFYSAVFEGLGIAPARYDGAAVVHRGLVKSIAVVFTPEFRARFDAALARQANQTAIVRYMEELWNQGDLSVADEILAADFVSHNAPAGDRDALKDAVAGFRAENPNAYFPYDDMTVTEDRVFIVNSMMMRPEGAAADAEGEPVGEPMVLILGVKDGKITDRWLFMTPE